VNTRMKRAAAIASGALLLAAAGLQAQEAGRSVNDGVYSAAQAERGSVAYKTNCAVCHGETLGGIDVAPTLVGVPFQGNWSGQPLGELVTRARTTMPLTDPGSLGAATVNDIIAFILKSNGYPAGSAELPRDAQLLQMIRFEAAKPAG
jgi:mono/diheme cytochrome c family protein